MRRLIMPAALLLPLALLALPRAEGRDDKDKEKDREKGFVRIFDGKTLKGWKVSAETGHSAASKNKSGGKWTVEEKEKAIFGTQDIKGNGGILITEEKYGDFEVRLDMRNDFGPDSGLFLRSNMKGHAYQAMIDYYTGGNLMGIYGEGIGGFTARNFSFGKSVKEIVPEDKSDFKLPIEPKKWAEFWTHGEWNELAARIEGNPPKITTWIKGVKFMEWKDDKKDRVPAKGGIALQVHGGGDHTKSFVRYRNIRVKKLD